MPITASLANRSKVVYKDFERENWPEVFDSLVGEINREIDYWEVNMFGHHGLKYKRLDDVLDVRDELITRRVTWEISGDMEYPNRYIQTGYLCQ
jgi:hypothetical protein